MFTLICIGTSELIAAHPLIVRDAQVEDPSEQLCRKNTGKKLKLRKWSRGHQFIVRGGGHIDSFQPLFQLVNHNNYSSPSLCPLCSLKNERVF